jgi:hypothetical protein
MRSASDYPGVTTACNYLIFNQLFRDLLIMGDLDYSSVFKLSYWEFLELNDIPLDQKYFIQEGCLVMILAMAWDFIDGSGNYIAPYISTCQEAISKITATDENSSQLIGTVNLALETAERNESESTELTKLSSWVHKEFVQGYFRKMAHNFDKNPYYEEQAIQ